MPRSFRNAGLATRIRRLTPIPLTVSVGVTEFLSGDRLDSVLARADAALYEAKALGRNRVIVTS